MFLFLPFNRLSQCYGQTNLTHARLNILHKPSHSLAPAPAPSPAPAPAPAPVYVYTWQKFLQLDNSHYPGRGLLSPAYLGGPEGGYTAQANSTGTYKLPPPCSLLNLPSLYSPLPCSLLYTPSSTSSSTYAR